MVRNTTTNCDPSFLSAWQQGAVLQIHFKELKACWIGKVDDLLRQGFVNHVADFNKLKDQAMEVATDFSGKAGASLGGIRHIMNSGFFSAPGQLAHGRSRNVPNIQYS